MKFELIDLILSGGIVQGLFLSIMLTKIVDKNKKANQVLAIILVITSLVLMGRMVIIHHIAWNVLKWFSFVDSIIFLFGPLNYFYFRRLISKNGSSYTLPFIHYLPTIICAFIFIYLKMISKESFAEIYQNGYLYWIYNSFELIGLVSNTFYLVKNYRLLVEYKKQEKRTLSEKQDFYSFLFLYLVAVSVCLIFWLFSYINSYYLGTQLTYITYDNVWITIPFFIYIIGYFSLKQPELFKIVELPVAKKEKKSTQKMNASEVAQLKKSLHMLLANEKLYMKSDLSLRELSDKMDTSTNKLSWLLNNEYKSNFYDYINQHRVDEFLKCVEHGEHINHTILGIAMDVGFKSKSTFNKAFKNYMNMTPSQYIKSVEIVAEEA